MGKTKQILAKLPLLLISLVLLASSYYIIMRLVVLIIADYVWHDKIIAFFLLLAEGFIIFHGIGYFAGSMRVIHRASTPPPEPKPLPLDKKDWPWVAIVTSSFKEPLAVLEDTLICFRNLKYPNKLLYLLDDTRYPTEKITPEMLKYKKDVENLCQRVGVNLFRHAWRGAKAGMINDFLAFLKGTPPAGFENNIYDGRTKPNPDPKYLVIFDADQNAMPDFLEPLVTQMEAEPKLAFVQTPQYYTNFQHNRIARSSGLQQAVFYEYICEGKSLNSATFCCGTNFIMRLTAINSIGGFYEHSVTEDFATSLNLHSAGWKSLYNSHVGAFGLGPEDLGGYFKQQFRWALGTTGMLRTLIGNFFRHPFRLSAIQWYEYFLSSSYYFVGIVQLLLFSCPIIYLFTSIPTYFSYPTFYIFSFIPYITLTLGVFIWLLRQRNYHIADIFIGQFLVVISATIYARATILGILGVKGKFGVTNKDGGTSIPLRELWQQLSIAGLSFAAIVWGINRLLYEPDSFWAICANMFWCSYYFCVFSSVLYFNNPVTKESE